MEIGTFYLILVAVLAMTLPLVPHMVRVRIGVLRWLGLNGLANWHQRGFRQIVIAVRVMMLAMILVLLWQVLV
jgi:hypothetical protein